MKTASANCRLAIGPANFAGQAFHWAEAVTRYLGVPATSFSNRASLLPHMGRVGFQFPVHHTLPHHRITSSWGRQVRMRRLLSGVTHLAIDGFLPVYGRLDRSHVGEEFSRFQKMGLEVALIAHGGDVRDPDSHMARYPFSYFRDAPPAWLESLRSRSLINRQTATNIGAPVFVSTPDLLLDLPTATWLPLAIDLGSWCSPRPPLTNRVPTFVHVPSRRDPPIKGTAVIDPILRRMHEQGRIIYLSPERLPHAAMRLLIQAADVVVDQILTGSYGVAAVEGMAAGRLVVGYIGEDVRNLMPESPPIVDAEPSQFADVMERILVEHELFAEQASMGPTYAQRWHGGLSSARVLGQFLGLGSRAW